MITNLPIVFLDILVLIIYWHISLICGESKVTQSFLDRYENKITGPIIIGPIFRCLEVSFKIISFFQRGLFHALVSSLWNYQDRKVVTILSKTNISVSNLEKKNW